MKISWKPLAVGLATEIGVFASGTNVALAAESDCAGTTVTAGINCVKPAGSPSSLFGADGVFTRVAQALIVIVGAVSVIMLIVGGLRYVLSSGESSAVKGAKDTILYAIIGIVVASLAFAAVSFIGGRVAGS